MEMMHAIQYTSNRLKASNTFLQVVIVSVNLYTILVLRSCND